MPSCGLETVMYDNKKKETLEKQIRQYAKEDIMVAYSGGVDSGLLLKLACEAACRTKKTVYAAIMQTKLHPAGEIEEAFHTAGEMGAVPLQIAVDELQEAGIMQNPPERCYLCKKYLFSVMKQRAQELGITNILEGTNGDDLHVYRPGIKAVRELGILSPLADAGMGKEEIRSLAAEYGLSLAKKPSLPCLATRFPYGTALLYDEMERVQKAEEYLRSFGYYNVRLRVHGDIARIELEEKDFSDFLSRKEEAVSYLKELGYVYITLDMEGFRSGSMDAGRMFQPSDKI